MELKNIVIASDSFKGSLSSLEVADAVKKGIESEYPSANVECYGVADGGEGTVDAIIGSTTGKIIKVAVSDPLGRSITGYYGVTPDDVVVVETATASGLTLLDTCERDPFVTTTFGTGELINHAINSGYRKFIVGLGGSATNDCGVGMLQALGFSFLDENGKEVEKGAIGVSKIRKIVLNNKNPKLDECSFVLASDVKNPLCGKSGCSYVFSKQKGATDEQIEKMDGYISAFADLTKTVVKNADKTAEGTGAAGGLGYAFKYYLNAEMKSGIQTVIDVIGLEKHIKTADLVITGEGRLDGQSVMGKVPVGIAELAKKHGKPVVAICGCLGDGAEKVLDYVDAYFPVLTKVCSLQDAMEKNNARQNVTATVRQIMRVFKLKNR